MSHRPTELRSPRGAESGVAIVVALFFSLVVLGLTVVGAVLLRSHRAKTHVNFAANGQAVHFSRSGLVEVLGWMRKQTAQPVLALDPVLDTSSTPPVIETIAPEIGIVREFKINDHTWGRYEVWKRWDADPNPTRLAWRQKMQCEDVSSLRGNLSPGSVWRVRSLGYVFRRVDPGVPWNQAPNHVIGQQMTEVEVRRLALQAPGQAALCVRTGGGVNVLTRGRVIGGAAAAGVYFPASTGTPLVSGSGASVTGTPGQATATDYDDSFEAVFGVTQAELSAMADFTATGTAGFPSPVPLDSVVYCTGNVTFTASKPLKGTGVVAVIGDTTISPGSYSAFSGLLYVQGNLTVREPCELQGAVVVTGTVTVEGSADFATITYDDAILAHLRQGLGTYRLASATARPLAVDR